MFLHQDHGAGGGNGSIMVGVFVSLCLASKKLSEREFFVPARTDLAVKSKKVEPNPITCALFYSPKMGNVGEQWVTKAWFQMGE
jgi:hypothetical protein